MRVWTSVIAFAVFLCALPAFAQEANVEDDIKGTIESEEKTGSEPKKSYFTDVPRQKGKLHYLASIGYALPVIDLENTNGSLPIRLGAEYFVVEGLALGLRFVFSPCFIDGSDTMFIFNLEPEILYMFKFGLDVYFNIGLMSVSTRTESLIPGGDSEADTVAALGLALGVSYNLFFTKVFALEIGAEFDMNFKGGQDVYYPLFFVGGRFSSGSKSK